MDNILTAAQIEKQFKSEWVLVEDPQTNEALEVQSGRVRWHSKDRMRSIGRQWNCAQNGSLCSTQARCQKALQSFYKLSFETPERMEDTPQLLEVVALTVDLTEVNLQRGQVGTVVDVLGGGRAFEVEFCDLDGRAYASLGLRPDQVMPLHYAPKAASAESRE